MAAKPEPLWKSRPGYEEIRYGENRTVQGITFEGGKAAGPEQHYKLDEITEAAVQMDAGSVKALTNAEVQSKNLRGTPEELVITSTTAGGRVLKVPWGKKGGGKFSLKQWLSGVDITGIAYDETSRSGTLQVDFFKSKKMVEPVSGSLDIVPQAGVAYGGTISARSLKSQVKKLNLPNWSPIEMDEVELTDNGIQASGVLKTSISVLDGLGIEVGVAGEELLEAQRHALEREQDVPADALVVRAVAVERVGEQLGGTQRGQLHRRQPAAA